MYIACNTCDREYIAYDIIRPRFCPQEEKDAALTAPATAQPESVAPRTGRFGIGPTPKSRSQLLRTFFPAPPNVPLIKGLMVAIRSYLGLFMGSLWVLVYVHNLFYNSHNPIRL